MKIDTRIMVEDYVYKFYLKISEDIGNCTPEDLMSEAIFRYAGMIADDLNRKNAENNIVH